jgi:ATP-binding cassette, subfamily B (MDR/TAP), member 10
MRGPLTVQRFSSSVRLQTDYGPGVPDRRPKMKPSTLLYTVEPKGKQGSFMRFVATAKSQLPLIGGALIGVALYSAATLAIPAGFGQLIDFASKGEMPFTTSAQLWGFFCVGAVGNILRMSCIGIAGERLIADLRKRLYKAIMNQPTAFFDSQDNRTGALVQRLSLDCNVVGSSLTEAIMNGSKNLLQTVGSVAVMLYYSPMMTGVIIGMIPPIAVYAGLYGRYVRRLQTLMQDAMADGATVAEERLGSIRTVKSFGREEQELTWYGSKIENVFVVSRRMLLWSASYSASLQFLGYGALYAIMWAGSMLVASGHLSPGILFSFVLYTVYCGVGLMGLTNLATEINKGYGASIRLFDILDRESALQQEAATGKHIVPLKSNWNIKFESVNFAYPSRPEAMIYRGLSVELKPSQTTCVVGASGSGKSSMALLLLKLYESNQGSITIDGDRIEDLETKWLRSKIGYVGQEPVLFGGTVAQNIAYGLEGRNWDEPLDRWAQSSVVDAATRANAHEFISSLPQGYETFVGEQGRNLSGGQKQRIAIARALIRSPNLLILDEATSALDSESEIVVHEAIGKLIDASKGKQNRMVLMFAHKLSMIRKADHIVVLDGGSVIAQGTFDEVSKNSVFCQLVGLTKAIAAPIAEAQE